MFTKILPIVTARDTGERLAVRAPLSFNGPDPRESDPEQPGVVVVPEKTFQTIEGFGGAFTESSSVTLDKLGAESRRRVLEAYFHPQTGLGYTLCRTHMNSCDFSTGNYACCDSETDESLAGFTLDRERRSLLPMIKEAAALAGGLTLFISPWSPPAWMKTNGMMNRGGLLKPEFRKVWAAYYVRFIQELEAEGIPVWGLTVQNEPAATQKWDSCIYSPAAERDFVRDHLGPALERAGLSRIKVIIWDHNREKLVHHARVAYEDPEASKYIWGAGFHWYAQETFDNLRLLHDAWPEKHLIFTEGCQEGGPHLGSWLLGERYARSMIRDLNRWTVGWVDWNLLLDEQGGPNHVGNFCSAPILADTRTDEVLLQSSYYYIGHFSRSIRPGARRVLCASTRDDLEATAFLNPDGTLAVVLLNLTETEMNVRFDCGDRSAHIPLPRRSITTLGVRS